MIKKSSLPPKPELLLFIDLKEEKKIIKKQFLPIPK